MVCVCDEEKVISTTYRSNSIYLDCDWQQELLKNCQIVCIRHANFVQGNIDISARAVSTPNKVKIRFTQIWPKSTVLEAMNGKINDSWVVIKCTLASLTMMYVLEESKRKL
jgi:hypothetical protein